MSDTTSFPSVGLAKVIAPAHALGFTVTIWNVKRSVSVSVAVTVSTTVPLAAFSSTSNVKSLTVGSWFSSTTLMRSVHLSKYGFPPRPGNVATVCTFTTTLIGPV